MPVRAVLRFAFAAEKLKENGGRKMSPGLYANGGLAHLPSRVWHQGGRDVIYEMAGM
jgi:hypothetical protein